MHAAEYGSPAQGGRGGGDAIREGRGHKCVDYYELLLLFLLLFTTPSAAVPPDAEAHLERLVTRLIGSSRAFR